MILCYRHESESMAKRQKYGWYTLRSRELGSDRVISDRVLNQTCIDTNAVELYLIDLHHQPTDPLLPRAYCCYEDRCNAILYPSKFVLYIRTIHSPLSIGLSVIIHSVP